MKYFLYSQNKLNKNKKQLIKISPDVLNFKFACVVENKKNIENIKIDIQFKDGKTGLVNYDYKNIEIDEFNNLMTEDFVFPPNSEIWGNISNIVNITDEELDINFIIYLLLEQDGQKDYYINTPYIIKPVENDVIKMSDINITSSKYIGNVSHTNTEYLISKYPTGVDPVLVEKTNDPVTQYILTKDTSKINNNEYYYLFVRYHGEYNTVSEYSPPVKVLLLRDYTTRFVFDTTQIESNNENKISLGFRLNSGIPSKIEIDWGDENFTEYPQGYKFTSEDTSYHSYKKAGVYTVTVKCYAMPVQMNDIYFKNTLIKILDPLPPIIEDTIDEDCVFSKYFTYNNFPYLNELPEYFFQNNYQLQSIDNCFENDVNLSVIPNKLTYGLNNLLSANELFLNCKNINIPDDLFKYCPNLLSIYNCFKNVNITKIPDNLLFYNTKIENVDGLFENTNITKIPDNLFVSTINLKNVNRLFKNTNISNIPSNLFSNNPFIDSSEETFSNCSKLLEIPEVLFRYNTLIRNNKRTFSNCVKLTSIPSDLFYNINIEHDLTECFKDCILLNAVPKNIISKYTKTVYGLFDGCTNIRTISVNAFSQGINIESFENTFKNTLNLEYLDAIFADCINVVTFKNAFYNSGIKTINNNVFKVQTKVQTFEGTFYSCKKLEILPDDLFKNCLYVKSFKNCFAYVGLNSDNGISFTSNLFLNNTKVKDFSFCFYSANFATELPLELFSNNIETQTFESCFENTNISILPQDLFIHCPLLENLNNCFCGCSGIRILNKNLLSKNLELKTAYNLFKNTNISSIPEKFFNNLNKLENLSGCFENTKLIYLENNLFLNCENIKNLNNCFYNCSELIGVEANIFKTNLNLKYVKNLFKNCIKLIEIPKGIFNNNSQIIDFSFCFQNCIKAKINNPFTNTDDKNRFKNILSKINFNYTFTNVADELVDDMYFPELWDYTFNIMPSSIATFRKSKNIDNILNYNLIPDNWK